MSLGTAFDRLRSWGYVCRAAITAPAIATVVPEAEMHKAQGKAVAGVVFTLSETVKRRPPDGSYPLFFGRPNTDKFGKLGKAEQEIGSDVIRAIKAAGGWCEWDGDIAHAILVKEN